MAQRVEVTPDGWIVTDSRAFRALTTHSPPRPWGYWDQIRSDRHEPIIVRMWVVGLGLIAAGAGLVVVAAVSGEWVLLLGGLLLWRGLRLLYLWVRLARSVVRGIRAHPVAAGVIDGLEPHPIVPAILAVGRAVRSSGEPVEVGAEVPLAREVERAGMPAEVLFVDDPTFQYRSVFAARPIRPRSGVPL